MDRIIKDVNDSFSAGGVEIPDFNSGDTIEVHLKIKEKNKERIQKFEGVVVEKRYKKGGGGNVRLYKKITEQIGVKRIIPFCSPKVAKIVVKQRASNHRRANLSCTIKER